MLSRIRYLIRILPFIVAFILLFFYSPKNTQAAFERVLTTPVLGIINDHQWENVLVAGPSVLLEGNKIRLWYGSTGIPTTDYKFQIGYAETENPLTYIRNNEPLINYDFVNTSGTGIEHPMIINNKIDNEKQVYEMWFDNRISTPPYFELYYSSSDDGTIWKIPQKIHFSSPLSWDNYGNTAPSVIYSSTLPHYRMWYSARGSTGGWQVGYATSNDGVNWDRQNSPVLVPDQPWESRNRADGIGNVNVIFENGKYHMFYHGDRDIGYAYSDNGISWTKLSSNPIFAPNTSDPANFDFERVVDPFILKYNNEYLLWYAGMNSAGIWQIGLAKSPNLPGTTITPIQTTPTLTPSPTLTPTITPSVTPSIALFSPIVVIPGLGDSWNQNDMLTCNPNTGGPWTEFPFFHVYDRLMNTFINKAGYVRNQDVYFYTYDWRQPLQTQATRFNDYLTEISRTKPAGTKFRLIGHSLGGLIIRSYLENYPNTYTDSALTVGAPHQGTIFAYGLWEAGKLPPGDPLLNTGLNLILSVCSIKNGQSRRAAVQNLVPSIEELLPVFNYLFNKKNIVIPFDTMVEQNDWLPEHPMKQDTYGIKFGALSGTGIRTLEAIIVGDPKPKNIAAGDWVDGKPTQEQYSNVGDGTVLLKSSRYNGAQNIVMNGNHQSIITSYLGISKILSFFDISAQIASEVALPELTSTNSIALTIDQPVSMTVSGPKNTITESKDNLVVLYNPDRGKYRVRIVPKTSSKGTFFVNILSESSEPVSTEYPLNLIKNKVITLTFDYSKNSPIKPLIKLSN